MESTLLKLNLGCGDRHLDGWVNVDCQPACHPDMVCDLEQFPWPFADGSVSEILLEHVLEHLGESRALYLAVIRELYRICRHGATIHIIVPHPRHDHYFNDPTHVRPILPDGLRMFDQSLNRQWIAKKWSNTPLGIYLGVDFRITECQYQLDSLYREKIKRGEVTKEQLHELLRTHNNVCEQIILEWSVVKEGRVTTT